MTIFIRVNSLNPGATKINVSCGGVSKIETSEVEFTSVWNTQGCASGNATATVFSRSTDDPNWQNPTVSYGYLSLSSPENGESVESIPSASFSADQTNLSKGQCTYLHWSTSNANSIDIDGEEVEYNGSLKVCPTVTKKYTLSAHGNNGDVNRNITVVVTTAGSSSNNSPQSTSPSSSQASNSSAADFDNGNVIEINGDIFVIVDGRRRHVPNPETLDALGISRDRIDNKGLSVGDLLSLSRGLDIPDVSRDPGGFENFKSGVFPNESAITPNSAGDTNDSPKFQNGDVIQIGNDIYIILNGQRHLIPNPTTLDSLGISRSMVNNKGVSIDTLSEILQGEDVPDVNLKSSEFNQFVDNNSSNLPVPTTSIPSVLGMTIKKELVVLGPENSVSFEEGTTLRFEWSGPGEEYLLKISGGPYTDPIFCDWQAGTSCTVRRSAGRVVLLAGESSKFYG
ncbi:MAG: hypothetical protein AB9891_00525 [Anaerolineaceae bacterium]